MLKSVSLLKSMSLHVALLRVLKSLMERNCKVTLLAFVFLVSQAPARPRHINSQQASDTPIMMSASLNIAYTSAHVAFQEEMQFGAGRCSENTQQLQESEIMQFWNK